MIQKPVYVDNHATTRVDPAVLEAMLPYFSKEYGNAASQHQYGARARDACERARAEVAALIGTEARQIVFTSGATESNNLAIKGVAAMLGNSRGRHIITSAIEHHAVLDPCRRLERDGFELTVLPVDRFGLVDPDELKRAIRPDTILVSVMLANNEIGTIEIVAEM